MGLFDDKEYEQMDWLNKAVEPYVSSFHNLVVELPSRVEISVDKFMNYAIYCTTVSSLTSATRSRNYLLEEEIKESFPFKDDVYLRSCFMSDVVSTIYVAGFEHADGTIHSAIKVDLRYPASSLDGKLVYIKDESKINDDIFIKMIYNYTQKLMGDIWSYDVVDFNKKIKEIYRVISASDIPKKTRTRIHTTHGVKVAMTNIILEDTWRIRNLDLFVKMVDWVVAYIRDGDELALANFIKLKCMTHNDKPIYSMEEMV